MNDGMLRCSLNTSHFEQFLQQHPATSDLLCVSDEVHFHLDGFVKKQYTRFWAFENPLSAVTTRHAAVCTVRCAISRYWLDLKDGAVPQCPAHCLTAAPVDNPVVRKQRVHEDEGCHMEYVCTWTLHESEFSFMYHMFLCRRKLRIQRTWKLLRVFQSIL
jgi:hypothetical protein